MLFSVNTKARRPTLVYLLFEHQSTHDPLMPARLFIYTGRIWDDWLNHNPRAHRIPPVFSVVLHHGTNTSAERPWSASAKLCDLYDVDAAFVEAARPYLPALQYMLDDLSCEADEDLLLRTASAMVRLPLLLLKNARHARDIEAKLGQWASLMIEIADAPTGTQALMRMMRYLALVGEHSTHEGVSQMLRSILGKRGEVIAMGFGQQLIQQGHAQGLEEGREEGRENALREQLAKLLEQRFGTLPSTARVRLERASDDELVRWFDKVITASSLEELLT